MDEQSMQEMYRLTKENNKMLHKMRRNAFWGGLIKILIYAVLFLAVPLWLYTTYVAPVFESTMRTMNQIQGTGAKAQAQMGDFEKMWKDFQAKFGGSSNSTP